MSGLFTIFNIANRGMSTQQRAINVTSHNIANANTAGYSRQRALIETTRPFGMPSLNNTAEPGQIGTGSQVSVIERVRDSFLDYQVRNETSTYGEFSARDKFLGEIEGIFNEPSDTGISTLVGKFFDSWHSLAGNPQSSNSRTIVVQQAAALADAMNHTATQLNKLNENVQQVIGNTVFEVNDVLNQINQLNQQIIGVKVSGQMPNDLMDRRDQLLDNLSSKFNIKIDKRNFEGFDVEPMFPSGENKIGNPSLIKATSNTEVKRLSYIDSINNIVEKDKLDENGQKILDKDNNPVKVFSCKINYYKLGDKTSETNKVEMDLVDISKEELDTLRDGRLLWTGSKGEPLKVNTASKETYGNLIFKAPGGELEGYRSVQTDINNYMDQIDRVAKALAFAVNTVHTGNKVPQAGEVCFFVNSELGKGENKITAANITVNKDLIEDVMKVRAAFNDNSGPTNNTRALAIAQLRNMNMNIQKITSRTDVDPNDPDYITSREDMFNDGKGNNYYNDDAATEKIEIRAAGSGMKIDNYFKDVIDRLGVQGGEAKRMVKNQETLLASFQQSREAVSGVSIDEEMASLIQYQHAYQANAKIISTVDELLDVVINGLKR
jgi:flagellar hook-associated protein 1